MQKEANTIRLSIDSFVEVSHLIKHIFIQGSRKSIRGPQASTLTQSLDDSFSLLQGSFCGFVLVRNHFIIFFLEVVTVFIAFCINIIYNKILF